jgi:hypothetical protein
MPWTTVLFYHSGSRKIAVIADIARDRRDLSYFCNLERSERSIPSSELLRI